MRWSLSLLPKALSLLKSFQFDSSRFVKTSKQFFLYGTTASFLQISYFPWNYWNPGTLVLLHFFTFSYLQKIKHRQKRIFYIHSRISSIVTQLVTINHMLYFNIIFLYKIFSLFSDKLDSDDLSVSSWDHSTFVFPLSLEISGLTFCILDWDSFCEHINFSFGWTLDAVTLIAIVIVHQPTLVLSPYPTLSSLLKHVGMLPFILGFKIL